MNIALLFNPTSGTGRRAAAIEALTAQLRQHGHRIMPMRVGDPAMDELAARQLLAASELLVIAGGDGTVNRTLPLAMATGIPVYHVPLGTENLFARQLGMRREVPAILRAIESNRVEWIDTAEANGRPFVIMCSAGPDADVVHRLHAARRGGITHLSYIWPIVKESMTGGVTPLSVEVDGRILCEQRRGLVVIANAEQYACRANPCAGASLTDGELDIVFLPAPHKFVAGLWLGASLLRVAARMPGHVSARGKYVVVVADEPGFHVQMDGEAAAGSKGQRTDELEVRVRPRSLRVLMP
ncbi:MAG: putative lipid kinase [Phycisphaerales bacterium]|nr:putative lipid kinase [Phycisphaerales bacterium]MCK6475834.1 hypothetical protein [Phycisphaerales bacterium]